MNGSLFDGDDELFKKQILSTKIYAEYGCGASTIYVANNSDCEIYSVDTSIQWIQKVKNIISANRTVNLHLADFGPLGSFGRPLNYEKYENFNEYTDWIWKNSRRPDLILIDGRFRVCCFLTCLLYGIDGTRIIFDDYASRPYYHFVERYLRPVMMCGEQGLFIISEKEKYDLDDIAAAINKFRFVFD